MVPTDMTALDIKDINRSLGIDQMQQVAILQNAGQSLRFKAQQAKDPDDRKKLLDQAKEAEMKAAVEVPTPFAGVVVAGAVV